MLPILKVARQGEGKTIRVMERVEPTILNKDPDTTLTVESHGENRINNLE